MCIPHFSKLSPIWNALQITNHYIAMLKIKTVFTCYYSDAPNDPHEVVGTSSVVQMRNWSSQRMDKWTTYCDMNNALHQQQASKNSKRKVLILQRTWALTSGAVTIQWKDEQQNQNAHDSMKWTSKEQRAVYVREGRSPGAEAVEEGWPKEARLQRLLKDAWSIDKPQDSRDVELRIPWRLAQKHINLRCQHFVFEYI